MITVYCPRPSTTAHALVEYFRSRGVPARRLRTPHYRPGEFIVNWGARCQTDNPGLNLAHVENKYVELVRLHEAGLPVPRHSLTLPDERASWLARRFAHASGNDLTANLSTGDYYVEYIPTTAEIRCHVLGGRVRLTGRKIPNPNAPYHPRYRAHSLGWHVTYRRDAVNEVRQRVHLHIAAEAVRALGYDFGAVDLGITADGSAVVFEVNSAPGLNGLSLRTYGDWILAVAGVQLEEDDE